MARYIDLEVFANRISKNVKTDAPEDKALIEWCKDECIRQGYAMPTADVVPRADVERLEQILNSYALQYGTVQDQHETIDKIKYEMVKEIFAKVLNIIRVYEYDALVEKNNYGVAQVRDVGTDILKLKDKYLNVVGTDVGDKRGGEQYEV